MQSSDLEIIRDEEYRNTYHRDMRRQYIRRIAHRVIGWYEHRFKVPQWQTPPVTGKRKTLSVCMMTMNSAERIRPVLKYVRSFADEIVVGVDGKTTDRTLEVCRDLADEAFIVSNDYPSGDTGLEAVVTRCRGDWILRVDDDEFIEPHFAWLKDGILADETYTHYKMPRLHLSSVEPLQWINDGYLYPDFQLRLFRNDPSLLRFPTGGHLGIHCAGRRGKINTVDFVHLNMAINPRFRREEKLVNKYIRRELDSTGRVHPVNEHTLLYEDFNYRIEPYRYPDEAFCRLLVETVRHQHDWFVKQQQRQPSAAADRS